MPTPLTKLLPPRSSRTDLMLLAGSCFGLGVAIDFLFNGVGVRLFTTVAFTEAWFFIYFPVFLTLAATISSLIAQSRWRKFTTSGTAAVIIGMITSHLLLIGHKQTHTFKMALVSQSPIMLLRSDAWPQILFLRGESLQKHWLANKTINPAANTTEPPDVEVTMLSVSDYGCIRSTTLLAVDNFDILNDAGVDWIWRLNKFAHTAEKLGPGMEDSLLPWCKHRPEMKILEGGPDFWRPWDDLLQKIATQKRSEKVAP